MKLNKKLLVLLIGIVFLTGCEKKIVLEDNEYTQKKSTEDLSKNEETKTEIETEKVKDNEEIIRYEDGYFLVGRDIPAGNYQLYVSEKYNRGDYYLYSDESKSTELFRASFNYSIPAKLNDGEYVRLRGYYAESETETTPKDLTYGSYRVGEDGIIKPGLYSFVYTGLNGDSPYGFFSIINNDGENSRYINFDDYEVFEERVYRLKDQNYKIVKYELKEGQTVELFHIDILNLD